MSNLVDLHHIVIFKLVSIVAKKPVVWYSRFFSEWEFVHSPWFTKVPFNHIILIDYLSVM